MILVITGMEIHPFDRLVRAVDVLAGDEMIDEDFFVQLGACTYQPKNMPYERYLAFNSLCDKISQSSAVITHAGVGSTLTCIQQGKFPIVVPRYSEYGEHVDDHQIPFAEKMAAINCALAVMDTKELLSAIGVAKERSVTTNALGAPSELTDWLESFWNNLRDRSPKSH